MDALYYLSSLIGVVWLVVWTIRKESNLRQSWSPFDIREPGESGKTKRPERQKRA